MSCYYCNEPIDSYGQEKVTPVCGCVMCYHCFDYHKNKSGECDCGKALREKIKIRPCFTELKAIVERQKQNLAKLAEQEEKDPSLISKIAEDNEKIAGKVKEAEDLSWKIEVDLNEMYRKKKW